MKKKRIAITIILIVCAFAIFTFLKLKNNKQELNDQIYRSDTTIAVLITWEQVQRKTIHPTFVFAGSFEPNKEIQILPERSGKVTNIGVELGDYVKKGQLIAHLDNEELTLNLANNQTLYDDALRTYERNKILSTGDAITKTALEKAELSLKSFKNNIDVLKKQMTYMNIYAPMNGYITSKSFELGSIISPGMPIAMITDIASIKLNILVPENAVTQFKLGNLIDVSCDAYAGTKLQGLVDYISVKADDSKNFLVKIKVSNNAANIIRAGMFGKAYFKSKDPINTLIISRNAIVGSTKNPQIYVIQNGKAVLRSISLGQILENEIEVVNGLQEGELVANSGIVNLANGIKVAQAGK